MYQKPEVTRYSGEELLDLMGPVETAYSCELRAPDRIGCNSEHNIFVDISEVPDFKEALFTWEDPSGALQEERRPRTEDIKDGWWTQQFTLDCSEILQPGWIITVILVNGGEATCSDGFTLFD